MMMSPHIPAFCSNCGLIFPALALAPDAADITVRDFQVQCGRCGAMAELPDGTFNVVDDVIEVLEGSALTRERLARLGALMDQARNGAINYDELANELGREDDLGGFAELVRKAPPKMRRALIVLLWFVIQTIATHEIEQALSDSPTRSELKQDLTTLGKQLQRDERPVQGDIQNAVMQALDAYNRERHPGP
jgi:hypothetical protein